MCESLPPAAGHAPEHVEDADVEFVAQSQGLALLLPEPSLEIVNLIHHYVLQTLDSRPWRILKLKRIC